MCSHLVQEGRSMLAYDRGKVAAVIYYMQCSNCEKKIKATDMEFYQIEPKGVAHSGQE